jgi:vacuolar protein sorting-associated protein 54
LQQFHQQNFLEVAEAVQQEQWSPADVPSSTQAVVNRILQSAVETPILWDLKRMQAPMTEDKPAAKQLIIEDRSYFAVTATLRCVEALEKYLQVVTNLPLLSTDVMSRIIEFLKVSYRVRV